MIASNVERTIFAFTPIAPASACVRSASMPTIVLPLEPTNSFGAYVGSVATDSVPFDFTFAGTRAATAFSAVALGPGVLEPPPPPPPPLLLPQPATADTAASATAHAGTREVHLNTRPTSSESRPFQIARRAARRRNAACHRVPVRSLSSPPPGRRLAGCTAVPPRAGRPSPGRIV